MAEFILRARAWTVGGTIKAGAAAIPEIKIAGEPTFCIGFLSEVVDIYHVNDYLTSKGWL
jgi:hypothetical protein